MKTNETIKIALEFPAVVTEWTEIPLHQLGSELKKIFAIYLYGEGRLTLQQACELAGITKWEFFELNAKLRVPVPYDVEELEQDRETLPKLRR